MKQKTVPAIEDYAESLVTMKKMRMKTKIRQKVQIAVETAVVTATYGQPIQMTAMMMKLVQF